MTRGLHVVVAGAGAAGLEALAALGELAGDGVQLTLLAPDRTFRYRPVSTARPFVPGPLHEISLADLREDLALRHVEAELALVDEERGALVTRSGEELAFDALVVAVGAHVTEPVQTAVTWHPDGRATDAYASLLTDLGAGTASRALFIVPPDAGWPLRPTSWRWWRARSRNGRGPARSCSWRPPRRLRSPPWARRRAPWLPSA